MIEYTKRYVECKNKDENKFQYGYKETKIREEPSRLQAYVYMV